MDNKFLSRAVKFNRNEPHQVKAFLWLQEILATNGFGFHNLEVKDEVWLDNLWSKLGESTKSNFVKQYRNEVEIRPRYFSQRDNPIMPLVTCNSSSHAMYVDYHLRKAGRDGLWGDSDWVKRVFSGNYGTFGNNPSVSWDIQMRVARSLGVRCRYSNAGKEALLNEIKQNNITCINIWHKGTSRQTRGGGHIVLVAGYDKAKGFEIYDPFGSRPPVYSDKVNGVYWMSENEFNFRWQGMFTEFQGFV